MPDRPKKQLSVMIDADVWDQLDEAATSRIVGKQLLVENALRPYLAALPSVESLLEPPK